MTGLPEEYALRMSIVGHAQDLVDVLHALHVFNLGDDVDIGAAFLAEQAAHLEDILRRAGKGGSHEVHAVAHAKGDVLAVLLAEVGHAEIHIGHVDALAVAHHAVVVDHAHDLVRIQAAHGHAHQTVVDEDGGAFADIAGQLAVGDGGALGIAGNGLGAQREGLALLEFHLVVLKQLQTDFRAAGIQHDGDGLVQLSAQLADAVHIVQMELVIAVGEVEAGHVHAAEHEFAEHLITGRGRAHCADNLGLALDHGGSSFPMSIDTLSFQALRHIR